MNLPKYHLESGQRHNSYEFISEDPKGFIVKRIQFTLIDEGKIYNLAFGDKNSISDEIDDLVISNNGDSEKVLATVIEAVLDFCKRHPNAWIYVEGSNAVRTRLYRMGITRYLEEMQADFILFGEYNEEWEVFEKDRNYTAFLAKLKTSNFI